MVGMYSLFPHGSSRLTSPERWTCVEDLVVKGGGGVGLSSFLHPPGRLFPQMFFFSPQK